MLPARAYAKLNLCLAVSPPEPQGSPRAGWHRIASWFAPIDLCDELTIERAELTRYERAWAADAPRPTPIDWPEDTDLACRAHRLLESVCGRPLPLRLRLVKRIPTGGGLGGGSSDAAAVLRAVARLYDLPLGPKDLREHSRRLGSDVAYFIPDALANGQLIARPAGPGSGTDAWSGLSDPPVPAFVSGFGDAIAPASKPAGPVTLILPEFGCATPAVYRAFDGLKRSAFRDIEAARIAQAGRAWSRSDADASIFNDLAPAAELLEPRLAGIRRALEAAGHRVHMSGSGSTLFVLGDEPIHAPAGCAVVRTRFI